MIVYKGFNEKVQATCGKGTFQYEVGKTYREEKARQDLQDSMQQSISWTACSGTRSTERTDSSSAKPEEA